jgi:hypothetical protein
MSAGVTAGERFRSWAEIQANAARAAGGLEALGVRDATADHAASHVARAAGIATLLRSLPVHARLGQQIEQVAAVAQCHREWGRFRPNTICGH